MKPRYTKSQDGIRRASLTVKIRLEKAEIDYICSLTGIRTRVGMEDWLYECLRAGITAELVSLEDEKAEADEDDALS